MGKKVVIIGLSTGGPHTVYEILGDIAPQLPAAIVVVQHLPAGFAQAFAERLERKCGIPFGLATDGEIVQRGRGYVAPGDVHTTFQLDLSPKPGVRLRLGTHPVGTLHTPSVDVTMQSALECYSPQNIVAVLLTGMGEDGARAMVAIRHAGGRTIAESEETATVFGMPRQAIALGGAEFVLPAYLVGKKIAMLCRGRARPGA